MRRRHRAAAGLAAALLCASGHAAVVASVDRTSLAAGDTLQLTLQSDQGGNGEPDLAPLARDFDVLGRSSSSSLQIVNGHASSQRQLTLTLAPRHAGHLVLPPLQWGADHSDAIALEVASAGTGGSAAGGSAATGRAGTAAHVFFRTSVDNPSPYVQAAVIVRVRLYSDENLVQAALDLPGSNDVLVQRLGPDQQRDENRAGRHYRVVERRYVLQPQRSGSIRLPGPVLDAQVADANAATDPFFGRFFGPLRLPGAPGAVRPLRLHGDDLLLQVRPRPAAMATGDWLPAQQLTLQGRWQPDHGTQPAGQPVTLHLDLAAMGLSASQLPDLASQLALPPGLKAYPDPAQLSDDTQGAQLVGHRAQDIVLLADHAGTYALPALRVAWWNTATDQREDAVLPARRLDFGAAASGNGGAPAAVAPVPTPTPASTPAPEGTPAPQAGSKATAAAPAPGRAQAAVPLAALSGLSVRNPLAWTSLGFALLWLGTLGAWAWSRRRRAAAPLPASATPRAAPASASAAERAFRQACRDGAARAARDALLAWARAAWPAAPPPGLNALARRLGEPATAALLHALDRACLDGSAWSGEALARALPTLSTPATENRSGRRGPPPLPGLYGDAGTPSA